MDRRHSRFSTQAYALLRKNVTVQKRNLKTNIGIVTFPLLVCLLLAGLQSIAKKDEETTNPCGCACVSLTDGHEGCKTECGTQYPDVFSLANTCPFPSPPRWPALLQIPHPIYRASCSGAAAPCPASVLVTGANRTLAQSVAANFFASTFELNISDYLNTLADLVPGTDEPPAGTQLIESAFSSGRPLYVLRPECPPNFTFSIPIQNPMMRTPLEVKCMQGLDLWRESSSMINNELSKAFGQRNAEKKINEYVGAYDFLNSNENSFNVRIWYNSADTRNLVRLPRSLNVASNAYLKFLRGSGVKLQLEYVKEMPKDVVKNVGIDFASFLGPLFFTWIIELLFPVILTYLVYEKQHRLKIMMKMHGLGDGPYWIISYAYFLVISTFYMLCFVIFGSVIGIKFFTLNEYSIQFVFYFIYISLQIALAFFVATMFSDVKTATVIAYIYVFSSGLLGDFLFKNFVEDSSFSRGWIRVMEIVPGFSLFRGLYELSQYSLSGYGMKWMDLNDSDNGMKEVLIIMCVEWLVMLSTAYHLDQVASLGRGIRKCPLSFLECFWKTRRQFPQKPNLQHQGSRHFIEMEKQDVYQEREVVENLLQEGSTSHAIICDNLRKIYPGKDGNPEKFAVRGLSLALLRGECFGILGPNGAGKTSFINMMIGLISPTYGTAYVQGFDIRTNMDEIYTNMGVCPQHDLLWETLTGREHLMFYGRLKNLKGVALTEAVEESLKSVNLFYGGIGDKQVAKYSGGMKRRLSVAISLIGDPKVVYMDEPSTGLDPASRNSLWNVVKSAKQGRAIILTTHSMEEAEALCDRLCIFVDGTLQCIGNPKELKSRYGGFYIFTMTTLPEEEGEVESWVRQLSPSATKIYHIPGTQKFELPKQEVKLATVFRAIENAKKRLSIKAWGLADTSLEEVFIKVARGASGN